MTSTTDRAPGVYVEEIPPLARPIVGVGTSTAVFIGVADRLAGDTLGKPSDLFTNWGAFATFIKGQGADDNTPIFTTANRTLALAVYGFFNNGGTMCYVLPVAQQSDLGNMTKLLDTLKPLDDITIVAAPGVTDGGAKGNILDHCMTMQDRVALLDGKQDPGPNPSPGDILDAAIPTDQPSTPDKFSFGAVYFPWLEVDNPLYTGKTGDTEPKFVFQPPSGHVAGLWARVDGDRGVFKAPANEALLGVNGLQRRLDKDAQGPLNEVGINIIRLFGSNPVVYGARTIGGIKHSGDYGYLNVRRFMNFLKESIEEGTQFIVFEPNNPALWKRIIRSVSDFLFNQWNDGALFGETAKQAFFVKCDEETNPSTTRAVGQVITEIGVAVTKPAEFVIFRIQQTSGD
jgi:phage tail sheath protein FI